MTYVVQAPSEQILAMLPGSIGLSPWRVGIGGFTDDPAEQVVIVDTPGQAPNPLYLLDYPTFQVKVRGAVNGYQAAYYKARNVFDALLGIHPVTVANGDRWDGILAMGNPTFIGNDANGRPIFSINFRGYLEPGQSAESNRTPL